MYIIFYLLRQASSYIDNKQIMEAIIYDTLYSIIFDNNGKFGKIVKKKCWWWLVTFLKSAGAQNVN